MTLAVEAFNAVTVSAGGDCFIDPDASEILDKEFGVKEGATAEELRLTTESLISQIVGHSVYEIDAA